MSLTVNLRYTGTNGNALAFAKKMTGSGTVDKIRAEEGNLRYDSPVVSNPRKSSCLVTPMLYASS